MTDTYGGKDSNPPALFSGVCIIPDWPKIEWWKPPKWFPGSGKLWMRALRG